MGATAILALTEVDEKVGPANGEGGLMFRRLVVLFVFASVCSISADAAAGTVSQVRRAQQLLANVPIPSAPCQVGRRIQTCRGAAYAIGSPVGGRIDVVQGSWSRQDSIRAGSYLLVRHGPWKGINTAYDIRCAGRVCIRSPALLAWKVPVRVRGGDGRITHRGRVYTPASDVLRQSRELVDAGAVLLRQLITEERALLRRARVTSRAVSEALVPDVVPASIIATIFHVEKVDQGEFRFCRGRSACVRRLMEMNLVVLGANQLNAWRFTRSRTGARGPMQFMPGTWAMVDRLYPRARLPSFQSGASGLRESLRAAMLLIDSNLNLLEGRHIAFLRAHHKAFAFYAAAAYNGNPWWAITAIKRCDERWTERSCPWLRSETIVYLDEVEAIWPIVSIGPWPSGRRLALGH